MSDYQARKVLKDHGNGQGTVLVGRSWSGSVDSGLVDPALCHCPYSTEEDPVIVLL